MGPNEGGVGPPQAVEKGRMTDLTDEMLRALILNSGETFRAIQPPDGTALSVDHGLAYLALGTFILHECGFPPETIVKIAKHLAETPP